MFALKKFTIALLTALISAQNETGIDPEIECPILECTDNIEEGICYLHDGWVPTQKLRARVCADSENGASMFCPFDYTTNEYMWI